MWTRCAASRIATISACAVGSAARDRLIESAADNLAVHHDHRADRHLTGIARAPRLVERGGHHVVVGEHCGIISPAARVRPAAEPRALELTSARTYVWPKTKDPKPKAVRRLLRPFEVTDGRHFKLKNVDPDDNGEIDSREMAERWLAYGLERLTELQDKLYARSTWSVLLVFQAMDAAGKDSTIKHVMSGVNPQGCQVYSFKAPSDEELRHDFLWRCAKCLPERGRIGIFNRSYYEEVLVVRVHDNLLQHQNLPPSLVTDDIWKERYEDIRGFERHLHRSGTLVLKFFLHVSKKEQRKRFLERLDKPDKNWKFSSRDLAGTQAVEGLPFGIRRDDPAHGGTARAVVCRASGSQVVHATGGRRGHRQRAGQPRSEAAATRSSRTARARCGTRRADAQGLLT